MANGDPSGVWKWVATTLGGTLIGIVVATALMLARTEAMAERFRMHELTPGHSVMDSKMTDVEADIAEIKRLLEGIDEKIDRLHGGSE